VIVFFPYIENWLFWKVAFFVLRMLCLPGPFGANTGGVACGVRHCSAIFLVFFSRPNRAPQVGIRAPENKTFFSHSR